MQKQDGSGWRLSKIPVLEIFGPTIQGEGMVIGQKTMFVRTAGCDYSCSWCDSAFTWDGSRNDEIRNITAEEIWNELKELGDNRFSHVTISGGNPALIKNIAGLVDILQNNKIKIALETQGSRWQTWFLQIDDLTISPKPPSSGMKTDYMVLDSIIERLTEYHRIENSSLKVVVFNEEDFEYAKGIHGRYPQLPMYLQVGNDDIKNPNELELAGKLLQKYEQLIGKTINEPEFNDVRVLPQLHSLIWGNKQGV